MADSDYVFKAFLVNAFEYDNGNKEMSGVWVFFPAKEQELKAAFAEIGLPETAEPGQYFIDDYVSNIDSIKPLLHLDADVSELQETAARLNGLPNYEILKLNAVMETGARFENLAQVREFASNTDYYTLVPEAYTYTELGTYLIYESGIFGNTGHVPGRGGAGTVRVVYCSNGTRCIYYKGLSFKVRRRVAVGEVERIYP